MALYRQIIATHALGLALLLICSGTPYSQTNSEINVYRSLIIVNDDILDGAGLTFENTIRHILAKDSQNPKDISKENIRLFVQTLLDSLVITEFKNSLQPMEERVSMKVARFPAVKDLVDELLGFGGDPKYKLVPTAVVNRFDLAPKGFNPDCGEYRIVYSLKEKLMSGDLRRFFLIFEARLPNGRKISTGKIDQKSSDRCLDIARFWKSLSDEALDQDAVASKLNEFFYSTTPGGGKRAIHRENLGLQMGQVRGSVHGNTLSGTGSILEKWAFQEWRVQLGGSSKSSEIGIKFTRQPLENNPYFRLFKNKNRNPSDRRLSILKKKFKTKIVDVYVSALTDQGLAKPDPELLGPDGKELGPSILLINRLGIPPLKSLKKYQEFQAVVTGGDEYNFAASKEIGEFRKLVSDKLGCINDCAVNEQDLLQRAQAITCAGCHQFSSQLEIGGVKDIVDDIYWPAAGLKYHVQEPKRAGSPTKGNDVRRLSRGLRDEFLKFRRAQLAKYTNPRLVLSLAQQRIYTSAELNNNLSVRISKFLNRSNKSNNEGLLELKTKLEEQRQLADSREGEFVKFRRAH